MVNFGLIWREMPTWRWVNGEDSKYILVHTNLIYGRNLIFILIFCCVFLRDIAITYFSLIQFLCSSISNPLKCTINNSNLIGVRNQYYIAHKWHKFYQLVKQCTDNALWTRSWVQTFYKLWILLCWWTQKRNKLNEEFNQKCEKRILYCERVPCEGAIKNQEEYLTQISSWFGR